MRRIDIIGVGIALLIGGAVLYIIFQKAGFDSVDAGLWSQAILVGIVILWLFTYIFRVFTHNMTYNQQLKDYEEAVIEKRFEEMTPEELAKLQSEIEPENPTQKET